MWNWDKFYDQATTWIITTGPKILAAIVILFIGIWLLRVLNRWIKNSLQRRNVNPSLRYFLQNLIAIILQIFLILLVLQIAGLQLTFLTVILGGLTVAAGLALSGTLQNFVSGILILFLKPFRVTDIINTQGQEGVVTAIQLFNTTVLTYDNKTITIPNGQLSNNVVVNLSKEGKRRIDITLKFSYGIDHEKVKKVISDAVLSMQSLLADPIHRIGISDLEADKYTVTLNVWTQAHGFIDTKFQLQEKILNDLKGSGIKLPGMA
jgi:small conductance mechanosensitive channel